MDLIKHTHMPLNLKALPQARKTVREKKRSKGGGGGGGEAYGARTDTLYPLLPIHVL